MPGQPGVKCCCGCSCCAGVELPATLFLEITRSDCSRVPTQTIELEWDAAYVWGPDPFNDLGAWVGVDEFGEHGECDPVGFYGYFAVALYCDPDNGCWRCSFSHELGSVNFQMSLISCEPIELSVTDEPIFDSVSYFAGVCGCDDDEATFDVTVTE